VGAYFVVLQAQSRYWTLLLVQRTREAGMSRIRSIKPEWLEDELLALASSDARVLSIALILLADDYGNGRANRVMLAGQVFPGKVLETLANALDELVDIKFVVLYEVDGQHYFHLRNWNKHQKVDKPGKPKVPEYSTSCSASENVSDTLENILETSENPRASRGSRSRSIPDPIQGGAGGGDGKVPCPPDLTLTADQCGALESSMVPGWAIDVITTDFVATAIADPSDRRQVVHWRKCLAKAISGRWHDPGRRPKRPADEVSEAQTERARAEHEAAMEADRVKRRNAVIARGKANGVTVPPRPPRGPAQRSAILAMAGGDKP